jgi:hypothetical protein
MSAAKDGAAIMGEDREHHAEQQFGGANAEAECDCHSADDDRDDEQPRQRLHSRASVRGGA